MTDPPARFDTLVTADTILTADPAHPQIYDAALDRIVGHLREKGGTWFATRRQIAEHWLKRFG